jgi:hypothetical protein
MQRTLTLLTFLFITTVINAQSYYDPTYKWEIGPNIGSSSFLGDLGGQLGKGKYFVVDTDMRSTRPCVGIFARYTANAHFNLRMDLTYLGLHGDDSYAGKGFDPTVRDVDDAWYRYYRNLNFKTNIFEASISGEIVPWNFEIKNRYSRAANFISPYLTIGLGVFNFNPKGIDPATGAWVDLRPLRSEGQGILPGTAQYDLTQINIPMGVGVKWFYDDLFTVSLEANWRYTFTDYIDDVSGYYVDPAIFEDAANIAIMGNSSFADQAVRMHDKSSGAFPEITAPGGQRGVSYRTAEVNGNDVVTAIQHDDSYYSVTVRFGYFLKETGRGGRVGCPVW